MSTPGRKLSAAATHKRTAKKPKKARTSRAKPGVPRARAIRFGPKCASLSLASASLSPETRSVWSSNSTCFCLRFL
jgi:hypothetical protein